MIALYIHHKLYKHIHFKYAAVYIKIPRRFGLLPDKNGAYNL